jgi:alpha-ketoglutarate-dependent taurine dioxygenase
MSLPEIIESAGPGDTGPDAIGARREVIRKLLTSSGAVLLRGFGITGTDEFGAVVTQLSGSPLEYTERSSPRHAISDRIYTSTDYPPAEEIFLHTENSYQASWPLALYFYCVTPPDTLGATPLADTRQILAAVDPAVRAQFEARRWQVVRNFHRGFGPPWEHVFNTSDRDAVAEYCATRGIQLEWHSDGGLRTIAVRDAVHTHPVTGEQVWFNHATFFHASTQAPDVRKGLLELFDEDDLPTNTRFGDGGPIPDETVAHLRDCYRSARVRFDWEKGDIMMVDNMLCAHGREPFTGPRKIAVAMAEPHESRPGESGRHEPGGEQE